MAENKKDSFTFSDKIKNSKPAFNPFSKRASSKIGANGKPKKTIFERTKRDAPFFVAAAAALLMLPFLYKYSGNIEDGGMLVPPGSEDTIFDPERFGFDPSVEDPTGQIAQYTGRDSFDLIKGWGSDEEPAADDSEVVDWRVQDGLDDNWNSTPSAPARSYAPAATRAAFQRTPTKINELGSASLNLRGGGGSIGRFGGANLKAAARQDSSGGPRQGIKPVSLQPLRAADSPSRSYFGQGGAAQARASRDAMGKSNALQALSDAMFDPVRAGGVRGGGLGSGAFGTPGGGAQINHTLDYKGITPWWWDMMKERSQEAWRWKYFLWRKNLVEPLVQALAKLAVGFGCCLVSGSDDCSMGNFLGMKAGGGQAAKCCGMKESEWFNKDYPFTEQGCKGFYKSLRADNPEACPEEWEAARTAGRDLGFFGVRVDCLSNGIFGSAAKYGSGEPGIHLGGTGNCDSLNRTQNYSVVPEGEALKWNTYHYIVAYNYVPVTLSNGGTRQLNLCNEWGNNLRWSQMSAAAVSAVLDLTIEESLELQKAEVEVDALRAQRDEMQKNGQDTHNIDAKIKAFEDDLAKYEAKYAAKKQRNGKNNNNRLHAEGSVVREDLNDACVIYAAKAEVLNWEKSFKPNTIDMLTRLIAKQGLAKDEVPAVGEKSSAADFISPARKMAEQAFNQLDLAFIESISSKYAVSFKPSDLPMPYWQWFEANIERRGSRRNVDRRKHRLEGVDTIRGGRCYFDNSIKLTCEDMKENDTYATATVRFGPSYQGGQVQEAETARGDIQVTAAYVSDARDEKGNRLGATLREQTVTGKQQSNNTLLYIYDRILSGTSATGEKAPGSIVWNLYRGGELVQTTTCDFKNEGTSGVTPEPRERVVEKVVYKDVDRSIPAASLAESMDQIPVDPKLHAVALPAEGGQKTKASGTMLYSADSFANNDLSALDSAALASDSARDFINNVVDQYNATKRQAGEPQLIGLASGNPRLAEFVDAMYMAKNSLGMKDVPRSAVCEMGRAIALRSSDKTLGGSAAHALTNTFGTFAIYIGLDSVYFPNQKVKANGDEAKDLRFQNDPYKWGNYISVTNPQKGIYVAVQREIEQAKVNGRFPLASLTEGQIDVIPVTGLSGEVGPYRTQYVNTYGDILFKDYGKCTQLQGNMPIQDALDYMQRVIELGLNYKPKAVSSSGERRDGGTNYGSSFNNHANS